MKTKTTALIQPILALMFSLFVSSCLGTQAAESSFLRRKGLPPASGNETSQKSCDLQFLPQMSYLQVAQMAYQMKVECQLTDEEVLQKLEDDPT